MATNENVPPEFDQYARSYTELIDDPIRNRFARDPLHFHRRKWMVIEKLLQHAGADLSALQWLDVGCGRGELLGLAGKGFKRAVGCDPSLGMLSFGSPFDMYEQPSADKLPFADGSINFITAVCVYHHVHGESRTLLTSEIKRVLVPGGLCCIVEHNPWNPVTQAIVKRCPVDVDAELLTVSAVTSLFRTCGFNVVDADYFLYFPERLYSKAGALERMLRKVPFGGQYALLLRSPDR